MTDLFADDALNIVEANIEQFRPDFLEYMRENLHVYVAFRVEALKVIRKGFRHYSARTIIEVLRHNSALSEHGGPWKLNDHYTPYLARLFALDHFEHAGLFEFRRAKAAERA